MQNDSMEKYEEGMKGLGIRRERLGVTSMRGEESTL